MSMLFYGLGRWLLFQTFKELDFVKDKQSDVRIIQELIN